MSRPEVRRTYSNSRRRSVQPSTSNEELSGICQSISDDEEEERHYQRVLNSFRYYGNNLHQKIYTLKNNVASLPVHQQELLRSYVKSLFRIDKCIQNNQEINNLFIRDAGSMFLNLKHSDNVLDRTEPTQMDIDRVQVTLKQVVRDWSEEGKFERNASYQPIIDEIVQNFPPNTRPAESVKVLVPGAGLGRLAFEIASRGYTCQGNEFSLFMLIASNFILNRCNGTKLHCVYPWITQSENNMFPEHQMLPVWFPDVNPSSLLKTVRSRFTMTAGDFLEIYKELNEWDCVATSFFIDCAHNIVDFIEKIYAILKPGGVWINLGPLLYHFSNMPNEFSIEPPYTTVREVMVGVGFVIEKETTGVRTSYCQNPHSMLYSEYRSVFFVCRKPESVV